MDKKPCLAIDDATAVGDAVLAIDPGVGAELFPFGGGKAGAAFGFDPTKFDDALTVAVEHGVKAVAGVNNIGVVARAANESVVAFAALKRVTPCVADQEVGLIAPGKGVNV